MSGAPKPKEEAPKDHPPHILPVSINMNEMERLGLKEKGAPRRETVPYRVFSRVEMIQDVERLAIYSPWMKHKSILDNSQCDELLLVADPNEQYGENWFLVLSNEEREKYLWELTVEERKQEEENAKVAKEAEDALAQKREEEAALNRIVVVEEPVSVRQYNSTTQEESERHVRYMSLRNSRPLLSIRLQHCRFQYGAPFTSVSKEYDQPVVDIKSRRDQSHDLRRMETGRAIQAGSSAPQLPGHRQDRAAQTTRHSKADWNEQVDLDQEPPVADLREAEKAGAGIVFELERRAAEYIARALPEVTLPPRGAAAGPQGVAAGHPLAGMIGSIANPTSSLAFDDGFQGSEDFEMEEEVNPFPAVDDEELQEELELGNTATAFQKQIHEAIHTATLLEGGTPEVRSKWAAPRLHKPALIDESEGALDPPQQLLQFLKNVFPMMEDALSQNETLNIYSNEFALSKKGALEDESDEANEFSTVLKIDRQLSDLELTTNKALVACAWHPKVPDWIAVVAVRQRTQETSLLENAIPVKSHILLYILGEFTAQVALEAPAAVTCIAWCPHDPSIIVAGTTTGQVVLFDMTEAAKSLEAQKKSLLTNESRPPLLAGALGPSMSKAVTLPSEALYVPGVEMPTIASMENNANRTIFVKPTVVSLMEASHSKPVSSIAWIEGNRRLNRRNAFQEITDAQVLRDGGQFITTATDGACNVWDIGPNRNNAARSGTLLRRTYDPPTGKGGEPIGVLQSALIAGAANASILQPAPETIWTPIYKAPLVLDAIAFPMTCAALSPLEPSNPLVVGTMAGQVAAIDWAPAGEGTGLEPWLTMDQGSGATEASSKGARSAAQIAAAAAAEADSGSGTATKILWASNNENIGFGASPILELIRNPASAFTNVFLVLTSAQWSIWKTGSASPLLLSPATSSAYTCATWSPTRPSVLFVGRSDGFLEVWDLLDSTSKPLISAPLIPSPISCMSFPPLCVLQRNPQKQFLAVGDTRGALYLCDVPSVLRRPGMNEEHLFQVSLDREAARVKYVAERLVVRAKEKEIAKAAKVQEESAKQSTMAKLEAELQSIRLTIAETDPMAASEFDMTALEAKKAEEKRLAAEKEYMDLLMSVLEDLNIAKDTVITPPKPEVVDIDAQVAAAASRDQPAPSTTAQSRDTRTATKTATVPAVSTTTTTPGRSTSRRRQENIFRKKSPGPVKPFVSTTTPSIKKTIYSLSESNTRK